RPGRRSFPRNCRGRPATKEDQVSLCSPETAPAAAITGVITDPRDLGIPYPRFEPPARDYVNTKMLVPPVDGDNVELEKGPNIVSLPEFDPLPDRLRGTVLLRLCNHTSTDEIMPAGGRAPPHHAPTHATTRA